MSLISCVYYVVVEPLVAKKPAFADLLLLNGPGTCFVLCLAVYMNKVASFFPQYDTGLCLVTIKFLGLSASKIIYVESFARVKKLSLSGRLLLPLVDRYYRSTINVTRHSFVLADSSFNGPSYCGMEVVKSITVN